MKAIILSLTLVLSALLTTTTTAQAMNRLTAKDIAAAHDEVQQELKSLNKDFHIEIRERIATSGGTDRTIALAPGATAEDGSILLAAEVETLPGAEITEPWILASPQAALDGVNREEVRAFETAQLIPSNGNSDRRAGFRAQ